MAYEFNGYFSSARTQTNKVFSLPTRFHYGLCFGMMSLMLNICFWFGTFAGCEHGKSSALKSLTYKLLVCCVCFLYFIWCSHSIFNWVKSCLIFTSCFALLRKWSVSLTMSQPVITLSFHTKHFQCKLTGAQRRWSPYWFLALGYFLKEQKQTNASRSVERGELCLCLMSMDLWQEEAHHTDFLWHQRVT